MPRHFVYRLILALFAVTLLVTGLAMWQLYQAALVEARADLRSSVERQAHLMEAVARIDAQKNAQARPHNPSVATLGQIAEAIAHLPVSDKTEEFLMGQREGNKIVLHLHHHRDPALALREQVAFDSLLAVPMQRALRGQTGVDFLPDHHGVMVLAAYAPVPALNMGIVQKVDLAEIQAPFRRAALIVALFGFFIILAGTWLFMRLTQPVRKQLEKSEAQAQSVLDTVVDGIVSIDRHGIIQLCNPATLKLFGYEESELIGHNVSMLVPAPHAEQHDQYLQRYLETGQARIIGIGRELQGRHKDGSLFPLELAVSEVGNGNEIAFTGVLHDITERKQAEQARVQAIRSYRVISETNRAVVQLHQEDLLLHEVCRILVDTGGYPLAWVGLALQDSKKTVQPVASAGFEVGYLDQLDITWADETRGHGPTGTAIRLNHYVVSQHIPTDLEFKPWRDEALKRGYAASIALPLASPRGVLGALNIYAREEDAFGAEDIVLLQQLAVDLSFALGVLRNAVEKRSVEQALLISAAQLAEAQAIGHMGNWNWNIQDGSLGWSDEIYRIFGLQPQAFGATFAGFMERVHPDDRARVQDAVNRALSGQPYAIDHRITLPDGSVRFVHEQGEVRFDEQGKPLSMIGTVHDITGRKAAEARILDALTEKDTLLRELHHRVKNNMQVISSLLNLQARYTRKDNPQRALQESRERIRAMAMIHERLYGSDDLAHVELLDYLRYLSERQRRLHYQPGIELTIEVSGTPLRLPVDQALPCALMCNELITNAIQHAYTPEQHAHRVEVHVAELPPGPEQPAVAQITVLDHGVGIAPEVVAGHPDTLGMVIVRALARQLRGEVVFDTNRGTLVTLSFPLHSK